MKFQDALEGAQFADMAIQREGWNGKGMFVYNVKANAYPATSEVAKRFFGEDSLVKYGAYLAILGADGVVNPWTPSQADMAATDWAFLNI